jgi:hypothetical protein
MLMKDGFMSMHDGFMSMTTRFLRMKDGLHEERSVFIEEKAGVTFPPPTGTARAPVPRPLPATFGRLPRHVRRRAPRSLLRDGGLDRVWPCDGACTYTGSRCTCSGAGCPK